MAIKSDRYTYRITWSEEDKEYVGLCVEFPSLSWLDESPESVLKGIRKIVEDVLPAYEKFPREKKVDYVGNFGIDTSSSSFFMVKSFDCILLLFFSDFAIQSRSGVFWHRSTRL